MTRALVAAIEDHVVDAPASVELFTRYGHGQLAAAAVPVELDLRRAAASEPYEQAVVSHVLISQRDELGLTTREAVDLDWQYQQDHLSTADVLDIAFREKSA